MSQKIFLLLFVLISSGCATTGTLKDIRFHTENIEILVRDKNTVVEWESPPDYKGEFEATWENQCKDNHYYLFPSSLGDNLSEITNNKVDLVPEPSPNKDILLKYTAYLKQCEFFIAEKWTCRGNRFRDAPMDIVVINKNGEIVHSISLPEREGVPIKYWPELAGAGLIDGLLGILMVPVVIIGTPFYLIGKLVNPEEESNKSMQPTENSAAD